MSRSTSPQQLVEEQAGFARDVEDAAELILK